jgi:transcription antitermination factor NusG
MNDEPSCEVHPRQAAGWWAVYTKHQHEKRVAELLTMKGAEVFLPLYDTQRNRKYRTVTLALPLFPSYLFVREQFEMRVPVLSTPGVHMIVTRGPEYGTIPDCEIRNLRLAVMAERRLEPHSFLPLGERVRVMRGSLQGLEGILVRYRNTCRVVISVHLLSQSAAVEVGALDIAPALPCQGVAQVASYAQL